MAKVKKRPASKKSITKKKAVTKKTVNKSQAIRDYLKTHRNAGPKEVQAALAQKGIKVTEALVGNVKSNAKKKKTPVKKVTDQDSKKAAQHTSLQDIKQAGGLLLQAVELVAKVGTKEAQQLVSLASEAVKKIRSSK